jgi:HK97 gp10 family phage protein
MAKKRYEVKGLKELQKQLLAFDKDIVRTATRKAAKAAMEPVLERAKADAPTDTGNLRDSVKLSSGTSAGKGAAKNRIGWAAVKAGGRGKADQDGKVAGEYVLAQHYGTSRGTPENPFLLLSFVGHQSRILADYKLELTNQVGKGVLKMAKRNKDK